MRLATFTLLSAALLLAGCTDSNPPTWPDGAELTVKDVLATSATLDWPPAADDQGVAGYRIFKGADKVVEPGPGAAYYELKGLAEAAEHTFAIEAFDAAGNASKRLELTFATKDGTPPVWPEGAVLEAVEKPLVPDQPAGEKKDGEDQPEGVALELSWPAATDNIGVTGYRVKKGIKLLGETKAEVRTFRIATDKPVGLYLIEAGDAAGNWTPGPTAMVGDLAAALEDALPSAGVLKLIGDLGKSGGFPALSGGKFDLGEAKKAIDDLPDDVKKQGLDKLGTMGIEPGSLLGKDSKLKAPDGDLSLDLLQDPKAPKKD
jgi:chitin-binding protein